MPPLLQPPTPEDESDLSGLYEEDTSEEDALAVEEALADLDAEGGMSLEEFESYMRETYGLSH